MTTAMQLGETARDRADLCRRFKTSAAVFLHDDGIVAHLLSRIPRESPARQHEQTATRAAASLYQEAYRLWVIRVGLAGPRRLPVYP